MNGEACSAACGFCGRCTEGPGEQDWIETCRHPGHWRDDRGGCRLCGARPETLAKQAAQRSGISRVLPARKSA